MSEEEKTAHWFFTAKRSRHRRFKRPTPAMLRARRERRLSGSQWYQRYDAERRRNAILKRLILNYVKLRNNPLPSHTLRCTVAQLAAASGIKL